MRNAWWASLAFSLMMIVPWIAYAEGDVQCQAKRSDTQIDVAQKQATTQIDIRCPFGIDRAELSRVGDHWPASVTIRLHLAGLESFEATKGAVSLGVSVPSAGAPLPRIMLRQNETETVVDKNSPYWLDVRIVAEKKSIPLENGHFEIPLPTKLFEGNPQSIELRWVDFYRN